VSVSVSVCVCVSVSVSVRVCESQVVCGSVPVPAMTVSI